MRKRTGRSRRVLLLGDVAVKVARFGILRTLALLILALRKPSWAQERVRAQHKETKRAISLSLLELFFGGVLANRREYRLYRDHPELPIAPVRAMYLWGLILVMERGNEVHEKESRSFRASFADGADLKLPYHTCRINGQLRIIDYGHLDARRAFGVT